MCRSLLCSVTTLSLLTGLTAAAPKVQKTDAAASHSVAEVLRLELTADQPDRRDRLRPLLDTSPANAAIHWASGQVSSPAGWQDFSAEPAIAASDDRLMEYRSQRSLRELTPDRHRELAAWCRKQGLSEQERAHLWQTLLANPAQPEIWRRMGYQQVEGQWLSAAAAAAVEQSQRSYQQNLRRWQKQAQSISERLAAPQPAVRDAARQSLQAIDDEAAIPALELALAHTSADQGREFVAWVQRWPSLPATFALTRLSVLSPWDDVRALAIDSLRSRRWEHFIPSLLEMLSDHQAVDVTVHSPARSGLGTPVITAVFRQELQHVIAVRRHTVVTGTPLSLSTPIILNRQRLNPTMFQVGALTQERAAIANQQRLAEVADTLEAAFNDTTDSSQIEATLGAVTGEVAVNGAGQWWAWWASLTATPLPDSSSKGIVEVAETSTFRPMVAIMMLRGSCLPAGTLVFTESGHRLIESIQIGDRVLSKDVDSGELAYRVVRETTVRRPQPLVKLSMSGDMLEATQGHHFWVSGKGWRMAREIQPGDRLHGVHGTVRITDVSSGELAEVFNLVVDRASTYFVGRSLVLSHDVTFPTPTDTKIPGLAAR